MQDLARLIAEGNLAVALQQTQEKIRQEPAKPKLRILLFQLHCVLGNWDKALNQLNVLRELDPISLLMVQTYEQVLLCEVLRKQVFAAKKTPLIFGEPQAWIALLLEALNLENSGNLQQAEALRNKAFAQAPASAGNIDGSAFQWIADADSRLGPIVEVILNGRYYWIPFQQISRIELEQPADLRDVVWLPAQFTWVNGGQASALIPCRYPGSENAGDNRIQLSRMTEWEDYAEGGSRGLGQRLWATDVDDYALMDVRNVHIDPASGSE